jgi:hypothetical protein
MRKIRDVLRLTHAMPMSRRLVGEATGIGKTAVGEYVRRAAVAGLNSPIPDEIDDAELERRLFPPADAASSTSRTEPDWSHNHAELKRRGVTPNELSFRQAGFHRQAFETVRTRTALCPVANPVGIVPTKRSPISASRMIDAVDDNTPPTSRKHDVDKATA